MAYNVVILKTFRINATFILVCLALLCIGQLQSADIEKGVPGIPPDAKSIAGNYYYGDGTGYNVYLTLKENGSYSSVWRGCFGKYGEALGKWAISNEQIVLTPKKEKGMMQNHLRKLDALKFKTAWIFVKSDDREFYDKYGVSRYSCFQKADEK